jgi:drug/metabolite transporter (DMT)-like permease
MDTKYLCDEIYDWGVVIGLFLYIDLFFVLYLCGLNVMEGNILSDWLIFGSVFVMVGMGILFSYFVALRNDPEVGLKKRLKKGIFLNIFVSVAVYCLVIPGIVIVDLAGESPMIPESLGIVLLGIAIVMVFAFTYLVIPRFFGERGNIWKLGE